MAQNRILFFAFTGKPMAQTERIVDIQDGYECWNLKKFSFDDFVSKIQNKIPPANERVRQNYKIEGVMGSVSLGIAETDFESASWGLLIPDTFKSSVPSRDESLYLLNLYSPNFLYPLFHVSEIGIMRCHYNTYTTRIHFGSQDYSPFLSKDFVLFYKTLIEQSGYGSWHKDRIQSWTKEDWRLFIASLLYTGLVRYEDGKNVFEWQRESAEMATILEALFTAGDSRNEEVTYRLRKRVAALLSWKFPNVEKEIKDLYKARSEFVHGAFFKKMANSSSQYDGGIPIPDFNSLYKQKEYVRLALVAYLNLVRVLKDNPAVFDKETSVMSILEKSIIDVSLREKVELETREIFSLMPETNFRKR